MQNRQDHNLPQDAFHKACQEGNLEECKQLIKSNPDLINQLHSIQESTGIQWAVQHGQKEIVAWLLKQPNVELFINNRKNCDTHLGLTPYYYCVDPEIFSMLENAMTKELSTSDIPKKFKILCDRTFSLIKQNPSPFNQDAKIIPDPQADQCYQNADILTDKVDIILSIHIHIALIRIFFGKGDIENAKIVAIPFFPVVANHMRQGVAANRIAVAQLTLRKDRAIDDSEVERHDHAPAFCLKDLASLH